ncbi:hypothetical protein GSI_10568 [Ganoderma sinense ZZ0214-1]|uniref:Uncharacterized protein n=1 Tax=Ganoderma sinense ZZ0214-1 TaxID=1077348 RepID=A0A2G8S0X1_9APHY|nr:hypothetical protein GSI_10568 [Ganoderma sinense ZZ0214-1]
MSDTVNLIQHHRAAFIREDAALAVWAKSVQSALVALRQILAELDISLGGHDVVHIVDHNEFDDETTGDSGAVCDAFEEFINGYDDPADKHQDQSAVNQHGHNILLPVRTLDDADELEVVYAARRSNLFDSLSSDSLMLGGSPFLSSAVSNRMSGLCLDNTPQAPPSPTFSSLSFDFLSPSISSDSTSDCSVISTPLTIAPSVLSSPLSTWSSPQLPTISESCLEEPLQDTLPLHSVDPSTIDTPSKRKRSPKAKLAPPAGVAVPEKTRPRRPSRAATSPKVAPSPSPRARKTVSKATTPASPLSKRVVSPLPARSGRSRSSSISSTSSTASRTSARLAPKTTRSRAAQLTLPRVTHVACCGSDSDHDHDHEILESDDSGSEYEADPSELEFDDNDDNDDDDEYDEYRPAKRTRSLPCSTRAASPASSVASSPVRRKAVSPKLASAKKAAPKRRRSSFGCASSKKKKPVAKPEGPPPTCVWCDQVFTRESDVLRHEKRSCKWYPFDQEPEYCPLCDKEISRNDAVLRHKNSGDCEKRQSELREQGLLPPKTKTKTVASAKATAKKAAAAAVSPRRRSTRALSV